ncbi:hypothetical protein BLA60_05760 [Actinophytocola xinjiangensis]|uniref:Bacterial bifunctional deaminase-reductase C-terminal domain-containing protein n=1 Tax=Actinophytocola xinjiangensis TaxID=485602 RepID=A0A7Z0WR44_9PSEU|nr:dihydrofolate reductase family protein [Actinophytocola xinjiangensis]OLF12777.1 hypothetical protein BLA60_05760 [Actinophytocola xinjiangensis]
MSTIVVDAFLSLDGVMQAPGDPDEDRDDGFPHGGWQAPHLDDAITGFIGEGIAATEALLLGRRTYEKFAAHWPNVPDDHPEATGARTLDAMPKYVASRTLSGLDWQNSVLLGADVPGAVAALRARPGGEIHVVGSAVLLRTLLRHDLVDRYRLMIFPVVLGSGKRLFEQGCAPGGLTLTESRVTPGGALICDYRRTGPVTYGSFEA